MKKKILVTGSNGLVGNALRITSLKYPDYDFTFLTRKDGDLTKEKDVENIFDKYRPNQIIHTAAKVGGIGGNMIGHADYFYQNILINSHIIHNSWKFDVKKLLAFSSVCVFPDDSQILKEDNMHNGPPFSGNFAYAYAKRMVDVQIRAYKSQYNIKNYCSIIPSNIIGTHDYYNIEDGHVLPSLIHKIYLAKKNSTNLEVWGDGKSLREFIYAEDLAKILIEILGKDQIPERLTVAGKQQYSIREVVNYLVESSNFKNDIIYDKSKPNGQRNRQSDLSLLNSIFPNFKYTELKDAIKDSYDWFVNNYPGNVRL